MQGDAVVITSNNSTAANTTPVTVNQGGKWSLVITGTPAGTTNQLQVQNRDGNWANVSTNITTAGSYPQDIPAGQYRMAIAGTAPAALYATLVRTAY